MQCVRSHGYDGILRIEVRIGSEAYVEAKKGIEMLEGRWNDFITLGGNYVHESPLIVILRIYCVLANTIPQILHI